MDHYTYTLTIGIPAHNESANISFILESIMGQTASFYRLEKIYVICDGTTDDTEEKALEVAKKYPIITVINDHQRLGKSERLNELYRMIESDLMITVDADVALGNVYLLDEVVRQFDDSDVALVTTNNHPVRGGTFIENMVNFWYEYWYEVRKDINGGESIHNVHGGLMALRKAITKQLVYPKGTIANSQYAYFWVKSKGMKFYFAREAVLYFYSPSTLKDYLTQLTRYGSEKKRNALEFGSWIYQSYATPRGKKIIVLFQMFFRYPLHIGSAILLQFWLRKFHTQKKNPSQKEGVWKTVTSTKRNMHHSKARISPNF